MKRKWIAALTAAGIVGIMAACASPPQPFDYHDDRDEKPGPGLFSGDEGGLVIYGDPAARQTDAQEGPLDPDHSDR